MPAVWNRAGGDHGESLVRRLAALTGGLAAGLCVALLYRKVQQANLEPTPLLKLASLLLLGLGLALPWWLVNRWHDRRWQR